MHTFFHRLVGAGAIAGFGLALTSAAIAGEVNGKGEPTQGPAHANSNCAYSGLNDNPDEAAPNGQKTQNWGQYVKQGFDDVLAELGLLELLHPSNACNGHVGFELPEE